MKKMILVSNRLPVTVSKRNNNLKYVQSSGGLATGLNSFHKSYKSIWIGWPGITKNKLTIKDKITITHKLKKNYDCTPIYLSETEIKNYYFGFSNKIIWPLFHYFPQFACYEKKYWESYKKINKLFYEKIINQIDSQTTVWIHDYQLMLLPNLIRKKKPNAKIGFFLHIPFPSSEIFRLLPWREEILNGILGADLIGFHTYDYCRHFFNSTASILGYDHTLGNIYLQDRIVKIDAFPMGIDYNKFSKTAENKKVFNYIKKFKNIIKEQKAILSVDRLDYSKGIRQRLETYEMFLKKYPQFHKKVTFIMITVPSRDNIDQYAKLKKIVEEMVGRINGEFGDLDWQPLSYFYKTISFEKLIAFYKLADIAFITPFRDGMNLVAKEYLAVKNDLNGILILSETAGAAKELGEAIIVNPNNIEELVESLYKAFTMKKKQKNEDILNMRKRIKDYDVNKWATDFIHKLDKTLINQKKRHFSKDSKLFYEKFNSANKRLILLDYDGTLVKFKDSPDKAYPDKNLLLLLNKLAKNKKNKLVIISGRDRNTLKKWLNTIPATLIAEHGIWIKEYNKKEEILSLLDNSWKKEIYSILQSFVQSTPGSFIEEKEYSLAWHYRKSDFHLSQIRLNELKETLINLFANLNLSLLDGNKVLEIKNQSINKGTATINEINKDKYDFILAIGDDWTDEDMFSVIPEYGYSIKVGLQQTKAINYVKSVEDVHKILNKLRSL